MVTIVPPETHAICGNPIIRNGKLVNCISCGIIAHTKGEYKTGNPKKQINPRFHKRGFRGQTRGNITK